MIIRNINPSTKATVFFFLYKVVSGNMSACFEIALKTLGGNEEIMCLTSKIS